jgi:DNA helicase-2/ATP-dependent DNA helicase PcrA
MLDLANAVEFFNDTNKTNEITNFKKKWLDKDSNNNWIMYGQREVNKLLGAADIYEQYLLELSNKNLFDYDDMIYRAIKGLEQNDELRYSLHEQFLYIMLDEFQDTNRAQLKLVELLTNNPVLEGRPNVLAVGDDDQAIFSFQGAELSNMTRFVSIYKNTKIITLTDNYRSHSDILQTAHSVASSIEERLSNQLGKGNKQLDAKNTKLPKATIRRINFKSDIAQFDWVANQIEKQINNGTKPQEIAVLAPKHKHIEPLVAYLEAKSIPVRYEKRENILEDSKILEITSMAELVMAISNQNFALADSLWPTVLSADYWQLPTSLIWSLSWHSYDDKVMNNKTGHWQALMMQDPALKPISLFFAKLGQIQQHETLETMFDYLVGVTPLALNETDIKQYSSPYYEYYFSKQTQEHSPLEFTTILSNLTVLRQHLREYHNNDDTPLRLQDMLSFISDYRTAGEKLLNTSPYHSAINSVQLMTVYGAKGLEFETVYILATHDEVWGTKDKSPNSNIGLPPNLTYIRRAGSTKDEKKRIFFVALTRAKHTLYLTSYSFNFAGKTTNSLEFLNESDGKSLALPSHAQAITAEDSSVLAKDTLTHFWTTRHTQGANNTSLRDLVLPRLDTFQLSATHLNTFTDLVYGGPEVFFMNTVLKFPKAPTADGQFGNAIHETLESIQHTLRRTGELPDTDQTIDIFVTKLKAKKLSENEFERLKGRGTEALKKFLPWWWHNFIPQSQTEYSFRHEASFVSKAHLSGNLDQILIDPKTKQIRIIDFKTGKPQTKWQKDIKSHKYKQQLNFYKILVENSHSFKSYDVDEAKLVFIEPDTITGEMHELEIKYNKDELEKTRLLIKAVWNCIKNLDLPDTSNFKPDINGTIEFENWLIENKILK